jgi:hypothetical protein
MASASPSSPTAPNGSVVKALLRFGIGRQPAPLLGRGISEIVVEVGVAESDDRDVLRPSVDAQPVHVERRVVGRVPDASATVAVIARANATPMREATRRMAPSFAHTLRQLARHARERMVQRRNADGADHQPEEAAMSKVSNERVTRVSSATWLRRQGDDTPLPVDWAIRRCAPRHEPVTSAAARRPV